MKDKVVIFNSLSTPEDKHPESLRAIYAHSCSLYFVVTFFQTQ